MESRSRKRAMLKRKFENKVVSTISVQKNPEASRIQTWIIRVEGKDADHFTSTTPCVFYLYVLLFFSGWSCITWLILNGFVVIPINCHRWISLNYLTISSEGHFFIIGSLVMSFQNLDLHDQHKIELINRPLLPQGSGPGPDPQKYSE